MMAGSRQLQDVSQLLTGRQAKRQRADTAAAAEDTNHTTNPLLGLPCLHEIVALVRPIDSLGLGLACRALRRRWWKATLAWLERAVAAKDGWFGTVFRAWQATAYPHTRVTSFATSDATFAQWTELITTHILAPLRAGTPLGALLRQRPQPGLTDWMESAYRGSPLGRFGIFNALQRLPRRLLWERVWLAYAWLPRVWERLSLGGVADPRLYVMPNGAPPVYASWGVHLRVDHPLDRVLATVLPLCLPRSRWRPPPALRRTLAGLRLPAPVDLAPAEPLGRLARRLGRRWWNHRTMKFHAGPMLRQWVGCSLPQVAPPRWSLVWRRIRGGLLLVELRRGPALQAVLCRAPAPASGWTLLRPAAGPAGSAERLLRSAGQDGLGFFRRLGEHWDEVLAEHGARTGRCVWCSKCSPAARRTGQGPYCADLAI
jgi:hypothetical protein